MIIIRQKKLVNIAIISLLFLILTALWIVNKNNYSIAADARLYNASNIMSDFVMTNKNSMGEAEISSFLQTNGNCNDRNLSKVGGTQNGDYIYNGNVNWHVRDGRFVCLANETFNGESAARIIWQAAKDYNINPQVLIVLLEKEQGLITDSFPNSIQYRSATGYGCPDNAACSLEYFGFKNQVRNAANFFRAYQTGNTGWYKLVWPGNKYTGVWQEFYYNVQYHPTNPSCGSVSTLIENRSTASLYSYTPYRPNQAALNAQYGHGDSCSSYGNRNFWMRFQDWFGSTQNTQSFGWNLDSLELHSDSARTNLISTDGRITLQPGATAYVTVRAKNNGTREWNTSTILETTNHSTIRGDDWIAYNKTSVAEEGSVRTGAVGTYRFSIKAPIQTGVYTQYFNLHYNDSKTWFNNPDLSIRVTSLEPLARPETTDANRLKTSEVMRNGDIKMSPERHTVLRLSNGELQLFTNFRKVWSSKTSGDVEARLINQSDGNLVLYGGKGNVLWASNSDRGTPGTLSIQTDGNVVMYSAGSAIWQTATVSGDQLAQVNTSLKQENVLFARQSLSTIDRRSFLALQSDGNLVLYNRNRNVIWTSNTDGSGANRLVMQNDGNLVLYTANNKAVWASNSDGRNAKVTVLQDDLNLVMYDSSSRPVWATNTSGR